MLQFSAALLSRALGPLNALFSSPCGRHSNVAGRRRRSTRVRRYAPPPPPLPAPAPRLAPPRETIAAEEVALVRPYFAAHERLRAASPSTGTPAPTATRPAPTASVPVHAATPATAPEPPVLFRVPAPRVHRHETDEVRRAFALVQERAAAIVQRWRTNPEGDLLSGPAPQFTVVRQRRREAPAWPLPDTDEPGKRRCGVA